MSRRRRRSQLPGPVQLRIEAMSHEGRGIASMNGKTVFVFGALEGELVKARIQKTSRNFDQAATLEVLEPSSQRIEAKCSAFQLCGGCSLQHLDKANQIEFKQNSLLEMMRHANLDATHILPPLCSRPWGYRRKARLSVKYVHKKGRVLVGFRERNTSFLTDMQRCEVLIPEVGYRLRDLSGLIEQLEAREDIPQIEVAADDDAIVLVFRHLKALSQDDESRLIKFAIEHNFSIQLQSAGPDSIRNLYPQRQTLNFKPLPDDDIRVEFSAVDFVQVNNQVNQQMVAQALDRLHLTSEDKVLDLFCGLGNFTLPMALRCASVTGVEGDQAVVQRAREGARSNAIDNTEYYAADLSRVDFDRPWMKRTFDKILLDPPRSGAMGIAENIKRFNARIIVYISCQPASLVRDSKIICGQGYRLTHLGVMDMFPQTAHVESMVVFERT